MKNPLVLIKLLTNKHQFNSSLLFPDTGLITGLAVGAVAVLGIVILVSFLIWRSRSTHSDHVPIVDNEEVVI